MKTCTKCLLEKSLDEFAWKRKGIEYQSSCKTCTRKRTREHYHKNKTIYAERKVRYRKQIRKFVYNYLLEHCCVDCGESDPVVLQFDHVGEKTSNISLAIWRGWSKSKLLKEIEQCQIRCANCHTRKTAKEQDWYQDLIVE